VKLFMAYLMHKPRHEFPPDERRQLTLTYVERRGLAALRDHPIPYSRWPPRVSVLVSLAAFVVFGALVGIPAAGFSVVYIFFPLGGAAAWAVLCGPFLLAFIVTASREKQRVLDAVQAVPADLGTDQGVPGYAGDLMGIVTCRDGRLHVITPQGTAVEIPFSDIHVVEQLPRKKFSHFSGIDVCAKSGQWTEMRVMDDKEVLSVLENADVPMVRAVNRLRVNA
jgi:hypothetical protein